MQTLRVLSVISPVVHFECGKWSAQSLRALISVRCLSFSFEKNLFGKYVCWLCELFISLFQNIWSLLSFLSHDLLHFMLHATVFLCGSQTTSLCASNENSLLPSFLLSYFSINCQGDLDANQLQGLEMRVFLLAQTLSRRY